MRPGVPTPAEFDAAREFLERLTPTEFAELKASLDEAIAELDRGEGTPFDFDEIKRKGRELLAARATAQDRPE